MIEPLWANIWNGWVLTNFTQRSNPIRACARAVVSKLKQETQRARVVHPPTTKLKVTALIFGRNAGMNGKTFACPRFRQPTMSSGMRYREADFLSRGVRAGARCSF